MYSVNPLDPVSFQSAVVFCITESGYKGFHQRINKTENTFLKIKINRGKKLFNMSF